MFHTIAFRGAAGSKPQTESTKIASTNSSASDLTQWSPEDMNNKDLFEKLRQELKTDKKSFVKKYLTKNGLGDELTRTGNKFLHLFKGVSKFSEHGQRSKKYGKTNLIFHVTEFQHGLKILVSRIVSSDICPEMTA
jgi:hypothetical protein